MHNGKRIDTVIRWANGNVMVFDEGGAQVPELQGRYDDPALRLRIMEAADDATVFEHGTWTDIPRTVVVDPVLW
jgi:hypothetical protein